MPLQAERGKRSRPNVQRGGAILTGWEFVQETMLRHDEDMIADFADDIDTLLVFAGLFSSVLTAFLISSFVLLQPDDSQRSVGILSLIAIQNGGDSYKQAFLDDAVDSLPDSIAFHAPSHILAINALWFTSLVLSLDAALFGIFAKQWCREYLRWHSINQPPRENVLLRQVRFEAWERWRVASFIAAVPALLETALVLFLIGLLIFVPTFTQNPLTIVVSTAIGGSLIAVLVLTALPIFYRLCPFQSPTSWACVHLPRLLCWLFWSTVSFGAYLSSGLICFAGITNTNETLRFFQVVEDFVDDQLTAREIFEDWRRYNLRAVNDAALCRAIIPDFNLERVCRDQDIDFHETCVDVVQTRMLVRALAWVRCGSMNDKVTHTAVLECVPSIHATDTPTWRVNRPHVLSSVATLCPTDLHQLHEVAMSTFFEVSTGSIRFRQLTGSGSPFQPVDLSGPFVVTALRELHGFSKASDAWESDAITYEICHSLLQSDLLALVDDWVRLSALLEPNRSREGVAEMIAFLLCLLRIIPSTRVRDSVLAAGPIMTRRWAKTMQEAYRRLAPHDMAYRDGLVSLCVEVARLLGTLDFTKSQRGDREILIHEDTVFDYKQSLDQISWYRDCNRMTTWATLAVEIYHSSNDYEDRHQRYLFVRFASRALRTMQLRIAEGWPVLEDVGDSIVPIVSLLLCMTGALRWSLTHSWDDCGAYGSLPWIEDILGCYKVAQARSSNRRYRHPLRAILLTGSKAVRPAFLLLLRTMETCVNLGLISGPTSTTNFDELLDILGRPMLPELHADGIEPDEVLGGHQECAADDDDLETSSADTVASLGPALPPSTFPARNADGRETHESFIELSEPPQAHVQVAHRPTHNIPIDLSAQIPSTRSEPRARAQRSFPNTYSSRRISRNGQTSPSMLALEDDHVERGVRELHRPNCSVISLPSRAPASTRDPSIGQDHGMHWWKILHRHSGEIAATERDLEAGSPIAPIPALACPSLSPSPLFPPQCAFPSLRSPGTARGRRRSY